MSQVSNALFRLGDQFRRGYADQGQNYLDVAELGLKEAGLKRQARIDEEGRPARELGKITAERGLKQAQDLKAPARGSQLMDGGLGPLTMLSGADENGNPRFFNMLQYNFGEGTTYDTGKDQIIKKDGSPITNEELYRAMPRYQEWMTMNASPYRMARTARDEIAMRIKELGPDHPETPALIKKASQYVSLMKNPEWKMMGLEKRKAFIQGLPDDPFGEKTRALAQTEKEIEIVRAEAVAQTKRAHEVADIGTKHGQAMELETAKQESLDKRAELERENRIRVAEIRAVASGDKSLTENQKGLFRKYANDIVNRQAENMLLSPEWAKMSSAEKDAWRKQTVDSVYNELIMSAQGPQTGGALGGSAASSGPKLGTDGKYYIPDPARPGKYLRIDSDETESQIPNETMAAHTAQPIQAQPAATQPPRPAIGGTLGGTRQQIEDTNRQVQRPQPRQLSMGMQANVDSLKRGGADAVNALSQIAETFGLTRDNYDEVANALGVFVGAPPEEIYKKSVEEIKAIANEYVNAQTETRKGATNIQPYGFR